MKKHDHWIRDKTHDIIDSKGKRYETEVMDDTDFATYLKKLQEEVDKFMDSDEIDELVDVY